MTPQLVIFAKLPRAGAVKTRLARDLGWAEALRFYRHNLRSLIDEVAGDPRWHTSVAVSPDRAVAPHPVWNHPGVTLTPQGGGDLGARMDRVMRHRPTGPVIIVGSDIVGITRADIALAFSKLGEADAVFGPAPDGGYWLVGLKRRPSVPRAFDHVRWSTRETLFDTLKNLRGRKIAMLGEKLDVDEGADLRAAGAGKKGERQ